MNDLKKEIEILRDAFLEDRFEDIGCGEVADMLDSILCRFIPTESKNELDDYREYYDSVVSGKAYINTESPEGLHFRELIGRIEDRRRK